MRAQGPAGHRHATKSSQRPSEVRRAERLPVMLLLRIRPKVPHRLCGPVLLRRRAGRDERPLEAGGVRRLEHGALQGREALHRAGRDVEVATAVAHVRRREAVDRYAPLALRAPRGRAVHRRLRPEDDVPRPSGWVMDVLGKGRAHPVRKVGRHGQVELVRASHDAEAAIARLVVAELHRGGQQRRPQLPVHAAVLQLRVEDALRHAVCARDGAAVQLEALRVGPLRDEERLVVHPVPLSA
mmetsp:Transcript_2173/g.6551  ORF Transcript_2173/g.6551 Transcript_2173/m.6551 type:complete len:241 (+) Transcript_2173:131-853(+)